MLAGLVGDSPDNLDGLARSLLKAAALIGKLLLTADARNLGHGLFRVEVGAIAAPAHRG